MSHQDRDNWHIPVFYVGKYPKLIDFKIQWGYIPIRRGYKRLEAGTNVEETKQILVAIADLQANMRNVSAKLDEIGRMSTVVLETEQRAKSAHNRIDDLKADIAEKLTETRKDFAEKLEKEEKARERVENHITWLWRSVAGGLITLIFGVALYFITKTV